MHGADPLKSHRGDDRRLSSVLAETTSSLLAYLQRRVGADDAPDLLIEAMVIAWRRIAELPSEPERARMWLFGIARGTLRNYERGKRRREALAYRIRQSATAMVSPPADEGAEVRDALSRIDPDLAELVRLIHWDRFSIAEAAEVLQMPASTARSRYAAAKEALRDALTPGPRVRHERPTALERK